MAAKTVKKADVERLDGNGQPFRSQEDAAAYMKREELPDDVWGIWQDAPDAFVVLKLREMIRRQSERAQAEAAEDKAQKDERNNGAWDECYMVTFAPASSDNDRKFVPLACNGVQVQVPRNVPTPLPLPLIEAARNAQFEQIESLQGQEFDRSIRRTGEMMSRYPFSIGEKVSRKKYDELLREGTKKARSEAGIKLGDAA